MGLHTRGLLFLFPACGCEIRKPWSPLTPIPRTVLGADWPPDAGPTVPTPLPYQSAVGGYDSEEGEEEGGRGVGAVASALLGFIEQGLDSQCKPFHAAVRSGCVRAGGGASWTHLSRAASPCTARCLQRCPRQPKS